MIPGKVYTPELVLGIVWRRKWLILIPTVIVAAIAGGTTYYLPDLYRSEATILVVPQRVPENYVRSSITTKIEDRLRSINQQVRSRSRLERIIEDFNLYPERRKTDIMQDIVDNMSDAIDVNIVQGDVFRIAFTSDNARTAMQVTERLASFFIDESLKDRTTLAEGASVFLEGQVADSGRKLRETEQKLVEYKRKHDGELPTQVDANQQGLASTQMQLQAVGSSIDHDRDLQLTLQRRIQDLTTLVEADAAAPVVVQEPGVPQSKAAELEAARAELQRLRAKARKGHPDVDRQETKIARLEREAAEEAASATPLTSQAPVNSMAKRRLKELDDLRSDLDAVNRRIENAATQQRLLSQRIAEYHRRMEAAPVRDSELVELTRDYATLKSQYDSLSSKKLDSQLSANLERAQSGEQFRMLDPARLPERPSSPHRRRFYMLGIVLALAVGFGVAAGAEYLDHGLRSEDDVRLALALPVLATIPVIGKQRKKKRLTLWRKVAAGAAATVVLGATVGAVWFSLR